MVLFTQTNRCPHCSWLLEGIPKNCPHCGYPLIPKVNTDNDMDTDNNQK